MKRTSAIANSIVAVAFFISAPAIARQHPQAPTDPDLGLAAPATTGKLDIQPAAFGRLPWVVFDERSGLPQHTIVDLEKDARGFVWAATQDGPARYNGHAWET